jgi:hypothetical protein
MPRLLTTTEIAEASHYFEDAASFWKQFGAAWGSVRDAVWKLETRQKYSEPGNVGWELLEKGDFEAAVATVPKNRQVDVPLYASLAERNITFTRCRPVEVPMSSYLRWELVSYDFNAVHGERIFFFNKQDVLSFEFDQVVGHDFMVFDKLCAMIHNYNTDGLIVGGWKTTNQQHIESLLLTYKAIMDSSVPYREFLRTRIAEG